MATTNGRHIYSFVPGRMQSWRWRWLMSSERATKDSARSLDRTPYPVERSHEIHHPHLEHLGVDERVRLWRGGSAAGARGRPHSVRTRSERPSRERSADGSARGEAVPGRGRAIL